MRGFFNAEVVGFEPTVRSPARWFSKPVPSTTQTHLRIYFLFCGKNFFLKISKIFSKFRSKISYFIRLKIGISHMLSRPRLPSYHFCFLRQNFTFYTVSCAYFRCYNQRAMQSLHEKSNRYLLYREGNDRPPTSLFHSLLSMCLSLN